MFRYICLPTLDQIMGRIISINVSHFVTFLCLSPLRSQSSRNPYYLALYLSVAVNLTNGHEVWSQYFLVLLFNDLTFCRLYNIFFNCHNQVYKSLLAPGNGNERYGSGSDCQVHGRK